MQKITTTEWNTLVHLKKEITNNISTLATKDMELFTELFVKSLHGKGEYTQKSEPTNY